MQRIVIIGAGQAGCSLALQLRKLNFAGEIVLIGEESDPPYQRPPLSKAYLLGDMARERLYLRPDTAYSDANIKVMTRTCVRSIDTAKKTIKLDNAEISYDVLALTTGSSPIHLPNVVTQGLKGIHYVRTLADIDGMRADMRKGSKAAVIGGGYIGLEAAAVARKLGVEATVVEMAPRILQRVAAAETSDLFRNLHTSHGVTVLENTGLDAFSGAGKVQMAHLSDGETLPIDLAIIGVGIRPNTALADAAGLALDNGIATDELGRTSDPNIWAAGDCASFPHDGSQLRLESVPHAIDHAETVAANILGAAKKYVAKPWFWSDQYDVKLQIAGLNAGYDRIVTRKGEKPWATSHWYFAADRLLSVDAINAPRDYMMGKRWIEAGHSPSATAIEDPGVELKSLA